MKARVSSSEFDERAEYEETADSGSGFGDEKFEESVGFTSLKIDLTVLGTEKQDSTDSEKVDEPEPVFKKMITKRSSSEFDKRAENEKAADSGSGLADEKFEESVSFTSLKIDPTVLGTGKQDSTDSEKVDEPEPVFKKMITKRHSRTESVSITKLSDLQDLDLPVSKQECQIVVTEAEESDKSEDLSDKISSESSREIEISDRKSSEAISDRISSEDAVTEKKTSSEEEVVAPLVHEQVKEEIAAVVLVVKETTVQQLQDATAPRGRKLFYTNFDNFRLCLSIFHEHKNN